MTQGARKRAEDRKTLEDFPWASSRTLRFTAQGEFPLAFPPECPVLLHCLEFSMEHPLTPSYHEHLEITLIGEGRGRYTVDGCRYELSAGDLVIVGRGEFHLIEADFRTPLKAISLHFMPELVSTPGGASLDFEYLRPFHYRGKAFSRRLPAVAVPEGWALGLMRRIQQEIAARSEDYPLAVKTLLCDLLLGISRHYRRTGPGRVLRDQRVLDCERLRDVFAFIKGNCRETLSLGQVSRLARMSPAYFCRFFKGVTGTTLTEYVLRTRIDRGMEFLSNSSLSVTDIAYKTGFSSHSYFDRVFKRLKGVTPLEYRRRLKGY